MSEPRPACHCSHWDQRLGSELFPLWYDPQMNEWSLLHYFKAGGYGSLTFHFCPSCGGAMAESRRATFFTKPDEAELSQARALVAGVSSPAELKALLGPPDHESSWPGDVPPGEALAPFRLQYTYSNRWRTLQLVAQESTAGKMRFMFCGRYIAAGSAV